MVQRTMRMRPPGFSLISIVPDEVKAMPDGPFILAARAVPLSPEKPAWPWVPATLVMRPGTARGAGALFSAVERVQGAQQADR
jgi:hypothetical protein